MSEDRIGLIGICSLDGPVGPNGNHLRWTFPGDLGFPSKGFRVYRKAATAKPKDGIHLSQLPLNVDLPQDLQIDGVEIIANPAGRRLRCLPIGSNRRVLIVTPTSGAQIELRFPQPIAYAKLEIAGAASSTVRAYQNKRLLAVDSVGTQAGEVFCAGITRLTIDLGSRQISSIGYITEADACNDSSWTLIKSLPLPSDAQEALSRFESGLKNYYTASSDTARQWYEKGASEIVLWLKRLLTPTVDFFEDPDAPPNRLKIRTTVEGPTSSGTSSATYLQSVFLLAALDPNIARLMSLYWVDAFEPSSQQMVEPPRKDRVYDYKVEADWDGGAARCGLLLNLGHPPAPQPSINPDVKGEQIGGLRWVKGQPLGRLGLKWPKPAIGSSPQTRAVQPVLYELTRLLEGKSQKILEPILVDNRSWEQTEPGLYVDRDLPLGEYVYEVRPLDIFGQRGSAIKSSPIKLQDNEAPPPPIRARVDISQTGTAANLRLQFEFGASQHQQAPDVKRFLPYWRSDTLLTRALVRVVVTSTPDGPGKFLHTLSMKHSDQTPIPVSELKTFIGDVITNVISDAEQALPATERRRYRIARVDEGGSVSLEPTATRMTNGLYEVVQDPHSRASWTRLPQQTVSWREPISGVLRDIQESLPVAVLSKRTISPGPDPFASIPPEQRGRQFPNLPPPAEVIEVEINRLLTEPDLFAGGRALTTSNDSLDVVYVVSNAAAGRTRIALHASATVAVGDALTLSPPSELAPKVRRLRISGGVDNARLLMPGGEIAFDQGAEKERNTIVMRVISNAVNDTGAFDVMIRADDAEAIGALHINATRVRYYAPFVLTFPLSLSAGNSAPISLPLRASEGYRDGFISLSATDVRNNEGPLSAPAQFSVIRPQPTGAPSKPYPCGMDITAAAGYATPPDRAGRATVCVAWDAGTLDPADGARYEVARALDNSILAAHLRAWQMGKIQGPLALPVIDGQTLQGNLSDVGLQLESGLIQATFAPTTSVADPAIFRNGRLRVVFELNPVDIHVLYFQVTLAKSAGNKVDLLLRGPSEPLPTSGDATLEAPPDYSEAKNDIATLEGLALEVPDAFALVTGVPIEVTRFTDDVAGKGRNVFFYRVRAVDAAENRSEWSPISAPFYQVDTTPPEAPRAFNGRSGDRSAYLSWLSRSDDTISGYQVFRWAAGLGPSRPPGITPHRLLTIADLSPDPLLVLRRRVTLPPSSLTAAQISNVSVRLNAGGPEDLFIQTNGLTTALERRVINVNPLVASGTVVEILIGEPNTPTLLTRRPGSEEALTVENGSIDFSFALDVTSIEAVFQSEMISPESNLTTLVTLRGFLVEPDVQAHLSELMIDGLSSVVSDGTAVAAIVRITGGNLRVIQYQSGTDHPLTVQDGRVSLDLTPPGGNVLSIRRPPSADNLNAGLQSPGFHLAEESALEVHPVSGQIVAVSRLNPLVADGTAVTITLQSTNSLTFILDGDRTRESVLETGLKGGSEYYFALRSVRKVTMAPATPGGVPIDLEIAGETTDPVKVRILDRSLPSPPDFALDWVDPVSRAPANALTVSPAVRIRVQPNPPTSQIKIERRPEGGSIWSVPALNIGRGWISRDNGGAEWLGLDLAAAPDRGWEYRLRIRTSDNRVSPTTEPVLISPLL